MVSTASNFHEMDQETWLPQDQCTETWLPQDQCTETWLPQDQCTETWLPQDQCTEPKTNAQRHGCPKTNVQRHGCPYSPRYAGVPTTDFLKLFSPMTLAKPKSHSLAWGMPLSEVRRTFSGFRSQCTISFLCRY